MMWDQVLLRIVAVVRTDTLLAEIYGENMRLASPGQLLIPALEWTVAADSETELWAPCTIQFDQWTRTLAELVRSERRLRALFHTELPAEFDGLIMSCQYLDGTLLAAPDRDDFNGRALRFRFTPLRSRYALSSITHTP